MASLSEEIPMVTRVLFATHAPRHPYLRSFISYAQRKRAWELGIVSTYRWSSYFAGLEDQVEAFFQIENLVDKPAWENDPVEVARIAELVARCEQRTGIPLSRVILTGERRMGRGFGAEFYHWPTTPELREGLRDNAMPERLALRLFAQVDSILESFRPELVVMGHTSAPDGFVLTLLAETRNIPFVVSRPSKILSDRCFWTPDRDMLNVDGEARSAAKVRSGVRPGAEAQQHLAKFRSNPTTVAYIRRNWDIAASRTFVKAHIDAAVRAAWRLRWQLGGSKGPPPKPSFAKLVELYRSTYLKARQSRLFKTFTEPELAAKRYLLIALHKEPELAINFQVPLWHSQKNLIAWISKNLPSGYRLLVRDHRKNDGRRPAAFYRDIMRYPGVDLISPFDSQFKYIRNAGLIITENGSTGWEGLIFGKRVISLARNFYEPAGLTERLRDPADLGKLILRRLAEPEVLDKDEWDRRLACLVEAEMETTLPEDETSHDRSLDRIDAILRPADAVSPAVSREQVPVRDAMTSD
jgi:hypothetical protein